MVSIYSEIDNLLPVSINWWKYIADLLAKQCGFEAENISLGFVSKEKICELNRRYRDVSQPTDVLSYSLTEKTIKWEDILKKEKTFEGPFFGEIVISPEVVKENAERFKVPYCEELQRVILHGLLHLKGYNHKKGFEGSGEEKVPENEEMFREQEEILEKNRFEVFFPQLIIGLGNLGAEYEDTPHNAGFMFVEYVIERVASKMKIKLKNYKKFGALITETVSTPKVIFARPVMYMNRSGVVVRDLCRNLKIDPRESMLIVQDELDMRLGTSRFSFASSGKTHKGVKSIEQILKTKNFWRFRIGVDTRKGREVKGEEFVLTPFSNKEKDELKNIFEKACKQLICRFTLAGMATTDN